MHDQIAHVSSASLLSGGGSLPSVPIRSAPAGAPVVHAAAQGTVGPEAYDAAAAQVNQHLQQAQTDLKVQLDPGSNRTVFQVIQKGTGQVLLQVPSAEVLGMSRRVREQEAQAMGTGTLVDKEG